jgi:hypothetical protein
VAGGVPLPGRRDAVSAAAAVWAAVAARQKAVEAMAPTEGLASSWEVLMVDMGPAEALRPAFLCGHGSVDRRGRLAADRGRMDRSCSALRT